MAGRAEGPGSREEREQLFARHLREAHQRIRGERQLADYVAGLDLGECAKILAASPTSLASLAALRDECRVEADEKRSFEEVIRTWSLHVLSGLEGG
ncbi:MAG TPA: hypothetical protein VG127_06060 [Rubrobacteraceae bacterium]|jgi:hypothetical protein|nr:hypothetical protein [Rubrobacteraceae bacterium]